MAFFEKLEKLSSAMKSQDLDCIVIAPSGDMNYMIKFNPGGCERFQALFVCADKSFFYVSNKLYQEDMAAALEPETAMYVWDDSQTWHGAVKKAFQDHGLTSSVIGINDAVRGVDLLDFEDLFRGCEFRHAGPALDASRIIKTSDQISSMKKAALYADQVMEHLQSFIRPGITEKDIKDEILAQFAAKGAAPSFEPIVASGSNNSRPHYNRSDRIITKKDVIILDFGCMVNGFCSDTSRTYFVGSISPREKKIYSIVHKAFQAAADAVKQGVSAGEVDKKARQVIEAAGYGDCFINRTGHGIGMDVHEAPFIRGNSRQILEKGMAFSIEPGIYIPGEVGMRIEDIFIVNDQGLGESINQSSKEMIIIS